MDPALLILSRDFLAATADLTAAQAGGFFRLCLHQHARGDELPSDDRRLLRLTGLAKRDLDAILPHFPVRQYGVRRNPMVSQAVAARAAYRAATHEKAKKAAAARWPHAPSNAQALPEQCPEDAPSIPQALPKDPPGTPQALPEECLAFASAKSSHTAPEGMSPVDGLTAERIVAAYPRRSHRSETQGVVLSLLQLGHDPADILAKTRAIAARVAEWTEHERYTYLPKPPAFFGQGRYEDDPETWRSHKDDARAAAAGQIRPARAPTLHELNTQLELVKGSIVRIETNKEFTAWQQDPARGHVKRLTDAGKAEKARLLAIKADIENRIETFHKKEPA